MSHTLSNQDLNNKSISIYSDVCQNSAEIEQIYKNSNKTIKQKKDIKKENNIDNSHVKLYSKDSINEKLSNSEYKSCYEEKMDDDSINNNININHEMKILENIDNIDNIENIKPFDLSAINCNNNINNNFSEEKSDLELNKIFDINFDSKSNNYNNDIYNLSKLDNIESYKKDKNKRIPNLKYRNSNTNLANYRYKDLNQNNNIFNNRTFSSYSTNNKNFFESNKIKNKKDKCVDNKSEKDIFINKIKFEGIEKDEIDKDYFNSKFKTIPTNIKNINNNKNRHLKTLFEIQDFIGDNSSITVFKIDEEGKYFAIGFKSGIIKIYEIINYNYEKYKLIYDKNNLKEYLHFMEEIPFKTLNGHSHEIIDLFWLFSSNNYLLSSSLNTVILWNFNPKNNNYIIKKYRHSETIICISVNRMIQNMFATGCADNFIRIWKINNSLIDNNFEKNKNNNKNEVKDFYIHDKITCLNFLEEGNKIAIGINKGKILIYKIFPDISFEYKFDCKNRFGKPITNMNFVSLSRCVISSLDSRIRFVNIENGKIIHKYKGHENEKNNIKINVDLCNDIIISGSENGYCYLWNIYNKENNKIKNYSYEYFKPFSSDDSINVSQIISEKCYVNYFQKILKITNKIMLDTIIIIGNDKGRIKILLNIDESY